MTTPDLAALAKAWAEAQQRYTATWMDADRDRCRMFIDARAANLQIAESAFHAALAANAAEIEEKNRIINDLRAQIKGQ